MISHNILKIKFEVVHTIAEPSYIYQARTTGHRPSGFTSFFPGSGTTRRDTFQQQTQRPRFDTSRYTGGLSEDEQMHQALDESMNQRQSKHTQNISILFLKIYFFCCEIIYLEL